MVGGKVPISWGEPPRSCTKAWLAGGVTSLPVVGVPPALTVTAVATGAEALATPSSCQKYSPRRYAGWPLTVTALPLAATPSTSTAAGTVRAVYWFSRLRL
jgi:hypothetical protein